MPSESLSIYFTIKDGASVALASITDKTKSLDKENQQLRQSYAALQKANEGLIRRQTELKKELQTARDEAKDAKKAFDDLGDSVSQDAYDKAREKVENLRNEISATSKALRENEKIFKSNMETIRKNTTGDSDGFSMLAKGIVSGQVGQMLSSSLGGAAEAALTSAIGTPAASLISDTVSSAITGAAAGAMFGLPGMLVGGGIGAISGLVSGGTKIFETQDEAFKSYYGSLYDTAGEATENMITSGSAIAGSREQTQMAFAQRLGSDEAAEAYLGRVQDMAARTNYGYDEITGYSKLLLNSYDPEAVFGVLQSLSDATAALNLSSGDVEMMISGLSRMRTTGKATQEYLNYFSERGVDVYAALGQSLGVDKSQVAGLVTDGAVDGAQAAEAILAYINQEFGGLSEKLMGTYDAMVDNLDDVMASLEAQGGEGYNQERIAGIQAQQDAYSGVLGEAVGEINRIAGENKAYLENLSEQYTREALSAVLLGQGTTLYGEDEAEKLAEMGREYAQAAEDYAAGNQEAGLRMEALKEQAEALATAAYESSDQYMALQNVELDQIAAIRENTAALEGWRLNYQEEVELTKGLASVGGGAMQDMSSPAVPAQWRNYMTEKGREYPAAYGLQRVPYDNFPALLHEGERVLTAREARSMDREARDSGRIPALLHEGERAITASETRSMSTGSGGVTIQVGQLSVREEADVDRVAEALYERLLLANMAG